MHSPLTVRPQTVVFDMTDFSMANMDYTQHPNYQQLRATPQD